MTSGRQKNGSYFTTGEVARLLQVAPRTVAKWFDKGILKGYRLPSPGSATKGDRRVPRDSLVEFLASNNMPAIEEFEAKRLGVVNVPGTLEERNDGGSVAVVGSGDGRVG